MDLRETELSGESQIRPARIFIAVHEPLHPAGAATALEIAVKARSLGQAATIVRVPNESIFRLWSLRAWIWQHYLNSLPVTPSSVLNEFAQREGIAVVAVPSHQRAFLREADEIAARLPETVDGLEASAEFHGLLGRSILSWLATYRSRESPGTLRWTRRELVEAVSRFLAIRDGFLRLIRESREPAEVIAYNARVAAQVAPLVAALDSGSTFRIWNETAAANTGYYFLEGFRPHDRISEQLGALAEFESADDQERRAIAGAWLAERQHSSDANPYLQLDDSGGASAGVMAGQAPSTGVITFFTSSPDESIGVFGDWDTGEWSDQTQAFVAAAGRLRALGYTTQIRIHPNLINKSWREYRNAIGVWDGVADRVILPTDAVDSYRLVRESDAVFVWSSTIGLEASAMGVPTYCLGPTHYDLIADIREIKTRKELDELSEITYPVDRSRALPRIYSYARGAANTKFEGIGWDVLAALEEYDQRLARFRKASEILRIPGIPRALVSGPAPLLEILTKLVGPRRAKKIFTAVTRDWLLG